MKNLPKTSATTNLRSGLALFLAFGGTFLAFLDVTVTNLALPGLADEFLLPVTSLSWVITIYAILFAALLAPAGALADHIGRARLLIVGLSVFTAASAVAAAAQTFEVLLISRGIQGLGAALVIPASLGLVLSETPADGRATAIGVWSASGALAAAAGPALGGVLVDVFGWRSLFCVNLPLGIWLVYRARPLLSGEMRGGLAPDLLGSVLLALSLGGLVYAVTEGSVQGWSDAYVVTGFVVAVVAGLATFARASRHPRPALQVSLWRSPTYAVATVASMLYGFVLFASLLVGVLFLVGIWGYGELQAGLAMTPGALAAAVVAVSVGRLPRRPSPRALVIAGCAVLGLTTTILALSLSSEPQFLTLWLPAGLALGAGTGAATVGLSSAAALSVAPQYFAAATGLVSAARQVGGAIGVAIVAAILAAASASDTIAPHALVYWVITGVTALAGVSGLWLRLPSVPIAQAAQSFTYETRA